MNWWESQKKGNRVEAIVEKFMKERWGNQAYIKDVSDDKEWQLLGVDYLLLAKNSNRYKKVEIKNGVSNYQEVAIELTLYGKNKKWTKQGWFYKSQSDLMIWHVESNPDYFVIVWFKEFRDWFLNSPNLKKYTKGFISHDDNGRTGDCVWMDIQGIIRDLNPSWILCPKGL